MIADKVLKFFTTDNCLLTLLQIDEICLLKLSLPMHGEVSQGGTSTTQQQNFHNDDIKCVWKQVRSTDWI